MKLIKLLFVLLTCLTVASAQERKGKFLVFTGTANPALAQKIATLLGVPLGQLDIRRFNDGEIMPQFKESIRHKHIFVVQSMCKSDGSSVNDSIIELSLIVDAAKRASAKSITAVVPYYGYGRQDRKAGGRVPVSAETVAMILRKSGADRVMSVDFHCEQIQGFFRNLPVDNLYGSLIFVPYIASLKLEKPVVVSPDAGGAARARRFQLFLQDHGVKADYAMLIKERAAPGVVASAHLIGDIRGKDVVIVDDICDTGGTLVAAAAELKAMGARTVYACISHAVLSKDAMDKIQNSEFAQVIMTDTIPLRGEPPEKLKIVSAAPILAQAIKLAAEGGSISSLFEAKSLPSVVKSS